MLAAHVALALIVLAEGQLLNFNSIKADSSSALQMAAGGAILLRLLICCLVASAGAVQSQSRTLLQSSLLAVPVDPHGGLRRLLLSSAVKCICSPCTKTGCQKLCTAC